MNIRSGPLRVVVAMALLPVMLVQQGLAWGVDGHRIVNRLAGEALPADVPEFLRAPEAVKALEYYGPEPDRWKSPAEPELSAAQSPEHFIDLEYADLLGVLPRRRYDFVRALAFAQQAHPDLPLSPEGVGLLPYQATEVWERLKSAMRDYRGLEARHEDTKPVECEIVFLAGWLGHYVADGSQPMHTSVQYNGWTGPNPNGYTTLHTVHAQFESVYVGRNIGLTEVKPLVAANPVVLGDVFTDFMAYLRHTHSLVEKTYQLEKAGAFSGVGTPEGRTFTDERLAAAATELRDMIYTAWVKSADTGSAVSQTGVGESGNKSDRVGDRPLLPVSVYRMNHSDIRARLAVSAEAAGLAWSCGRGQGSGVGGPARADGGELE